VVALAVMSETAALSDKERDAILRTVADAARSRLPFIVGCSGVGVPRVTELVRRAHELGAAAALVSAPPLLRNVDSLPDFFAHVAERGLPLVIQDEPSATGVLVPVSILLASLRAAGSRAVKLEDPPTAPKIARLLAEDPSLQVLGGLGGAAALYELNRGACGTMTGFAFPEILAAIRSEHAHGDVERAGKIFDHYLPLIAFEAQPGIGLRIRKEVLWRRGTIACTELRIPAPAWDEQHKEELEGILRRLELLPTPERFVPRESVLERTGIRR
jgi:4-hydroxy-tetrahydrodipicolinate synthase